MKNKKITIEQIMLYRMSIDINRWLHEKGKDIDKYEIFLNRVCEIIDVLRGSLEKTADALIEYDPTTSKIEVTDFSKELFTGDSTCPPNTNSNI